MPCSRLLLSPVQTANNSVLVRTQLAEGLPRVQGDRVQLQQVLLNLIINAIEAMRDVGEKERELLVSSWDELDGVSVEVRDSGPGFAPATLDRVFEAFYITKPGGLGLGLSICQSIIEAHSGRLRARPNAPRGAVFRFIAPGLPAAASRVECRFGSKTWQTSSPAGTLIIGGETQWEHYGKCRLSVCARQRDPGYAVLLASVAIGRPCAPGQAETMPASYA
jgi:hypothetical protein